MISSVGEYIAKSEGCRYAAYDDATGEPVPAGGSAVGTLTIGYGHTGADVTPGLTISEMTARALLQQDVLNATVSATTVIPSLTRLLTARRWAFIDMAFELGEKGLSEFTHMLAAIATADWTMAASELLASDYAAQTPKRAKRNAYAVLNGAVPPDLMWD